MSDQLVDLEIVRTIVERLAEHAATREDEPLDRLVTDLQLALDPDHGEDQDGPMIEGQGVARGGGQQISLGPAARLTIEIFR